MALQKKPWLGKNGEPVPEVDLRSMTEAWGANTWEEFLKTTVECPLRETLSGSQAVENLEDGYRDAYQEMLAHEEYPNLTQLVRSLIKRLTIREREVVYATFWQGKSQNEIAKALKVKRSVIRNYRDRALKKLGVLFVEKMLSANGSKQNEEGACPQDFTQKDIGKREAS